MVQNLDIKLAQLKKYPQLIFDGYILVDEYNYCNEERLENY